MYTFLPIAPCTFSVNGKHFNVRINEPFSVELKEAKIIASAAFRFRKYVRLITPLPTESPVAVEIQEPQPEPVIEALSQPVAEVIAESQPELPVEAVSQPVAEVIAKPQLEEKEEDSAYPKRRNRRKLSTEEAS